MSEAGVVATLCVDRANLLLLAPEPPCTQPALRYLTQSECDEDEGWPVLSAIASLAMVPGSQGIALEEALQLLQGGRV